MPEFGSGITTINPTWGSDLASVEDGSNPVGGVTGPDMLRTDAGVYLFQDVGDAKNAQTTGWARAVMTLTGAGAGWLDDTWAPNFAQNLFVIRGAMITTSATANISSAHLYLIDSFSSDAPMAYLVRGHSFENIDNGVFALHPNTPGEVGFPFAFRQHKLGNRWGLRFTLEAAGVTAATTCNIFYSQYAPGVPNRDG